MNHPFKILFQSFVKSFYKENAGAFVFVFTIMFCIVSKVDGAGLYEYHYSLATAMLKSTFMLFLVLFIWFLYVRKCFAFVSGVIANPHYSFLQVYNQLSKMKRLQLFFIIEVLLLMPILLYVLFISFVGFKQGLYFPVLSAIIYLLLLCIITTALHVRQLDNLNKRFELPFLKIPAWLNLSSSYPFTLTRFVAINQINIWIGIKIFTCCILYLIARNNNAVDHDTSMAFLFYSFGILANGVLIFRIRAFEEIYLSFYRALPISLIKRFSQYAFLYFILLIPEFITILTLMPVHIQCKDALNFILCGFSLSLLMNSFTFLENFKMKEYVVLLLATFCIECILLMTVGFVFLYLTFFALSVTIFLKRYYKFEQSTYN